MAVWVAQPHFALGPSGLWEPWAIRARLTLGRSGSCSHLGNGIQTVLQLGGVGGLRREVVKPDILKVELHDITIPGFCPFVARQELSWKFCL